MKTAIINGAVIETVEYTLQVKIESGITKHRILNEEGIQYGPEFNSKEEAVEYMRENSTRDRMKKEMDDLCR